MKKLIVMLLAVVLCASAAEARTFALLVGMSNYDDPEVTKLPSKDVTAFRDVLKMQTKDVTLLTSRYATKDNIFEKLGTITSTAQKGDRIIFFFNGHGFEGGIGVYKGHIFYRDLVKALADTKATEVFVFINACHSGSAAKNVTEDTNYFDGLKSREGHVYMLSSRSEEFSWSGGWLDKGFFTQALLTGYRGKADTDHDRTVTVLELFKHIHKDVVRRSEGIQHPVIIAPKSMHDVPVIRYSKD